MAAAKSNETKPSHGTFGLPGEQDASISVILCVLAGKIDLAGARALRPALDLTPTEWRVISTAGAEPGVSPLRVAEVAAVDKSVISRAVKSLIRKRLVEARPDPSRSRWTKIFLTSDGQNAFAVGSKLNREADGAILSGFDADDRATVLNLLHRILTNVNENPALKAPI